MRAAYVVKKEQQPVWAYLAHIRSVARRPTDGGGCSGKEWQIQPSVGQITRGTGAAAAG